MRPTDDFKKLINKSHLTVSRDIDNRILGDAISDLEKLKQTQSARPMPNMWRIIMKSRISKLSIAVAIVLIAMAVINHFGGSVDGTSVAWAEIITPILNANTVSFDVALKFGGQPEQESHFDCLIPGRFIQTMPDGIINIIDYSQQKALVLDTNKKIAELRNLKDKSGEMSFYNVFIEIQNLVKQTINMEDDSVSKIGNSNIKGQEAIGFKVQLIGSGIIPGWYGKGGFIVWIQPETNIVLQLEWHSYMTGLRITVNNLVINRIFDESIFSQVIPQSYKLKIKENEQYEGLAPDVKIGEPSELTRESFKTESVIFFEGQIDIPEELLLIPANDEQKIINFFWSWSILSEGLLPSSLSTDAIKDIDPNATISFKQKGWGFQSSASINLSNTFDRFFNLRAGKELSEEERKQIEQKHGPIYENLQRELEEKMEKFKPLIKSIGDGFSVIFQMPADSNWHYAGQNVEFGDSDAAIFWYRPKGSEMYRVIYGDLSVKDISLENQVK